MGNVLNDSLNPGDRSDAFRLMAMELDSSGLELQRPLGTYDIFNRQIVEDMKYKAPIDFTLELVGKFKPLSQSMKEASNTVDVLRSCASCMTSGKRRWMRCWQSSARQVSMRSGYRSWLWIRLDNRSTMLRLGQHSNRCRRGIAV